jgi:hypothetical protein
MSAAVALLCFAMAGAGMLRELVPALALSAASLILIAAVWSFGVLRSRSAYTRAGS